MIRPATASDTPTIYQLIYALAEYERLRHEVSLDENKLREHLFGPRPYGEVLLAEDEEEVVGFALFFHNFSTFLGKPGLYLEDLFVKPEHRGKGHGKALLRAVVGLALERGCGRLEWSVLKWNEPAIGFYQSMGAVPLDEWTVYRLTGEALRAANNADNSKRRYL
jgi:GNAT superfamily N-acetyltransferase